MRRRVISHDQWREELNGFSLSREGWIVRIVVTEPGGRTHVAVRDVPLQGVVADFNRAPTLTVMVGDRPDTHLTHQVMNPKALEFEETDAGAISALVVRSDDGTKTEVEFRSPMRPEEVDGLPVGRSLAVASEERTLILTPQEERVPAALPAAESHRRTSGEV
jgi:uncharacterized protein DUF5335